MKKVKFFVGNIFSIEEEINNFFNLNKKISLLDIKLTRNDTQMIALVIYDKF